MFFYFSLQVPSYWSLIQGTEFPVPCVAPECGEYTGRDPRCDLAYTGPNLHDHAPVPDHRRVEY